MFDKEEFLKRPPQEILDTLKALSLTRDELVVLARHLEIEPKTSSTKPEIRQLILPVLVTKNIVGEESDEKTEEKENTEEKEDTETSTMMVKTRNYDQEFELEKLKLQMELEKMRLEREEKEKERQERERERQEKERERQEKEREIERQEKERERERQEKERERERQERERERERQERERERQEKERERERERQERERESARQIQEREKERQFELEKLKLQQLNHPIGQSFDVIKNFQAVPSFQEDDVDMFFLHFEKLATNLNWPKDHWTILLQKAFVGKAREIFAQLSVEQSQKYEYVKDVVLRGYQLNPEAYRQKFRNCQRDINQTFVEFARVKEQLFDRWCHSKKVNMDFEKLRQLILIEEFKRRIPFHMKTFIDEKQVENLQQAADLADEYFPTHGNFNQQRNQSSDKQYTANPSSGSDSFQQPVNSTQSMKSNSETSAPFCNYCKRRGHLRSECFYLIGNQPSTHDVQQPSPSGHIVPMQLVSDPHSAAIIPCETGLATSNSDRIMEMFEPFIQNGFVSLSDDFSDAKPIRILRDTGSAQSILLQSTLPLSDSTYSGDNVLLKGVDTSLGSYPSAPLHQVYISSSHVNGPVTVGITSSLPIDGIDFLLGNDLAGGKVVANSLVTDMPCNCQQLDPVPNLDPAGVVTRASKEQESITDTLVWESTDEETSQEDVSERPESPRLAKKEATKQKSQGAGNDNEVESKKLSRRKSTEKGTYTETMSKRKKERHKHLEENQHQHEEKHQKEEEERRKRAVAKPAKEKKESEDEDEEEVKSKNKHKAKTEPEPKKTATSNNNPRRKKTKKKKRNSQRHRR